MRGSDLEWLAALDADERERLIAGLDDAAAERMAHEWSATARAAQLPPPGDWRVWMIMAGRGFGKTRAGAEWVRAIAEGEPGARIALVGATLGEARGVMVEGASGLLSIAPWWNRPDYFPALRRLTWPNGAVAHLFGAAEPDSLRGAQFSHGWADEIGKWPRAQEAWDNLDMGMRLGRRPQLLATTTPRPVPLVRRLAGVEDGSVVVTRGRTRDNRAHLADGFVDAMEAAHGGTRLGRQELEGELIEDVADALWSRAMIEERRVDAVPTLVRVVIGVDPPAGIGGDACGIVAVGKGADGYAYVLEDASVSGLSPEGWASAVAACAARHGADRVVAESNQGGAMVASVLRAADAGLPVRLVHASRGKAARAEPVVALYEGRRAFHVGAFPALEDELCGLVAGGGYEGPGRSPDRADALVWAMFELMLGGKGEAVVRVL